jgi:hypothetical protein
VTPKEKKDYDHARYVTNKEALRASKRAYYTTHKEQKAEYDRKYRVQNRDKLMASNRRRRGLPEPLRPKPTHCECCGGNTARGLHLDHTHGTELFRGWLCSNCNTGIGKLGDNVEGLKRAITYLERSA